MKKFLTILTIALCGLSSRAAIPAPSAPEQSETTVTVQAGGVEIANPASEPVSVEIYAITGRLVSRTEAPHGTCSISLTPGTYILRVPGRTHRIALR